MTTKLEQAATMALEALSNIAFPVGDRRNEAVTALREALAEQAWQEPVALIEECREALAQELMAYDIDPPIHHVKQAHDKCVAWLFNRTAPIRTKDPCHPWQDLTDDEIAEITKDFGSSEYRINRIMCARAVIAAYKEKNK